MNCSHFLRFSFHCTCSEMSNLSGFCQTRGHRLVLLSFLPVGVCILNLGQRTPQDCFWPTLPTTEPQRKKTGYFFCFYPFLSISLYCIFSCYTLLWPLSHFGIIVLQVFDQYVKTRAEEERKEKKNKLMQAKDEFRRMMEEAKLTPRWQDSPLLLHFIVVLWGQISHHYNYPQRKVLFVCLFFTSTY